MKKKILIGVGVVVLLIVILAGAVGIYAYTLYNRFIDKQPTVQVPVSTPDVPPPARDVGSLRATNSARSLSRSSSRETETDNCS